MLSFFRAKSIPYFFAVCSKALILPSVISMLDSPAFCFASCFRVCFPWGCFSCCFFACASMALIAFCSISAVSFAPLTESATTFSLISSCNVYRPPFPVVIVLGWHAALLNPHPQPVQVLGADTYKIPVVPVLNPGRLPFAACEYVHALAAMQTAVIVGNVKANVVAVSGFVKNQSSCFLCHVVNPPFFVYRLSPSL